MIGARRARRGSRADRLPAGPIGMLAVLAAVGVFGAAAAGSGEGAAAVMIRRVLEAPEATATVVLERSDPFGGAPERERGRVWFIPGRGLRYRAEGTAAHEIVVNRAADRVALYRPSEPRLYEAPWARAPRRLRQLVAEPDRVIRGASDARPESRSVRGATLAGWRLGATSLGDSLGRVSVWIAGNATGQLRFVSIANEVDTLLVEFREWSLRSRAKPADLDVRAPRGTPVSPLDPRELLDGSSGTGGAAESR